MAALTPTEHAEQVALVQWARVLEARHPELALLFAIPNAGAGAQRGQAGKMKAEGVKAGVPDLCLPVARNGAHGLFIELKRRTRAVVSPEQYDWIYRLRGEGYVVHVCRGWDDARDLVCKYLGITGGHDGD